MVTIYARLFNQYKSKYLIFFSDSFYKINEEDQRSDKFEFFTNFNNNHNWTEPDNKNIDVKSQLKHQIQTQEAKDTARITDEINSLKTRFFKTGELNVSSHLKLPLRTSALLNTKMMINIVPYGQV